MYTTNKWLVGIDYRVYSIFILKLDNELEH